MSLHGWKIHTHKGQSWDSFALNVVMACGKKLRSRQEYVFSVDATKIINLDLDFVNTNKICTSPLLSLFDKCQLFWQKLQRFVNTGVCAIAKAHGNNWKKQAFHPYDPSTMTLHNCFKALMSMGEVCAMQIIQDTVRDTSTRDDKMDTIYLYLPSNRGTHPSYYGYCSNLGYKAGPTATGNIQLTWQGTSDNQENPPFVSIHTN